MKKIIPILFIIVSLAFGGCSIKKENLLAGKEQVEALREAAKGWESGRYLFTDLSTGDTNQVFSFMYEPDGSQVYLYETVSGDTYTAEYYGQGTIWLFDGEEVSVHNASSGDYEQYTKDNPHPYSTGDLLFYENLFVLSSAESTDGSGNTTYLYNYDTGRINNALGTSLTKFITTYTFDAEGNFLSFTQSNSDGSEEYSYMIELLDINSLTEIENPMNTE